MLCRALLPAILIALATEIPGQHAVPEIIKNERADAVPVWVSADVALTSSGDLRSDVMPTHRTNEFRRRLEQKVGKTKETEICDTTTSHITEIYVSTASAADLVRNSRYIFRGAVRALGEGFFFGSPGTLIAVDPEQWLKHETHEVLDRPLFFFFSRAAIATPHGTICAIRCRLLRCHRSGTTS